MTKPRTQTERRQLVAHAHESARFNWPKLIQDVRELADLNQTALARLLHCSQSRVSKFENGLLEPDAHDYLTLKFFAGGLPGGAELFFRFEEQAKGKFLNS